MEDAIAPVRRSRTARMEAGEYALVNSNDAQSLQEDASGWTTALAGGRLHAGDGEIGSPGPILPPISSHGFFPSTRKVPNVHDERRRSNATLDTISHAGVKNDTLRQPLPLHLYQLKEGKYGHQS